MTQERGPLQRAGKAALEKDAGHWGLAGSMCMQWLGRGTGTGCAGVIGGYHVEKGVGSTQGCDSVMKDTGEVSWRDWIWGNQPSALP